MSWGRGWYGWDVDSDDACAWGPYETAAEARCHPDPWAQDDAEVRVFHISVSDTPSPRRHGLEARQALWTDGPDSEAARAARGEGTRLVFDFDGTEVRLSYDTVGRSWMWHADGRAGGARTVSEALFCCGIWLGRRGARQLAVDALEKFS